MCCSGIRPNGDRWRRCAIYWAAAFLPWGLSLGWTRSARNSRRVWHKTPYAVSARPRSWCAMPRGCWRFWRRGRRRHWTSIGAASLVRRWPHGKTLYAVSGRRDRCGTGTRGGTRIWHLGVGRRPGWAARAKGPRWRTGGAGCMAAPRRGRKRRKARLVSRRHNPGAPIRPAVRCGRRPRRLCAEAGCWPRWLTRGCRYQRWCRPFRRYGGPMTRWNSRRFSCGSN